MNQLPRIIHCAARGQRYLQWATHLACSIADNAPGWGFDLEIPADHSYRFKGAPPFWISNIEKIRSWAGAVTSAPLHAMMLFLDADQLVLRDPDAAFIDSFDVAYTTRPGRIPINAGALYVRAGERSRRFLWAWVTRAEQMTQRPLEGDRERIRRFVTPDQAALYDVVHQFDRLNYATIAPLPCKKFNAEQQSWPVNDETVVLHVKNRLRQILEGAYRPNPSEKKEWLPMLEICAKYGWPDRTE